MMSFETGTYLTEGLQKTWGDVNCNLLFNVVISSNLRDNREATGFTVGEAR